MEWHKKGERLPGFELPSTEGRLLGPSTFRQRHHLLLVFVHHGQCQRCRTLLEKLAKNDRYIRSLNTKTLVVLGGPEHLARQLHGAMALPFPFLFDPEEKVSARYLSDGCPHKPAIVVADRYGIIWCGICAQAYDGPVALEEAFKCLDFIELQCPECDVPDDPPLSTMR